MKHDKARKNLIDAYVARLLPPVKGLAEQVRAVVREAAPQADEELKWGNPCYSQQGPLCYISATRTHVNLGFFRGEDLTDPDKLLEGDGSEMRHIKIRTPAEIHKAQLTAWIRQAVELNRPPA